MPTLNRAPTAFEQHQLELINRARANPAGELDALFANPETGEAHDPRVTSAIDYFGVDVASFAAQIAALPSVAPLAWNAALAEAALGHSEEMIRQDAQSHQLPGEASMSERIVNAGYTGYSRIAENVYAYADGSDHAHAGFYIDWGYDDEDFSGGSLLSDWRTRGDGIQDPAGHRVNILKADYTEIGVGAVEETSSATSVGDWVVTQNFGNRFAYEAQLLGVVFDDGDADAFYDIGEGLGDVLVTAQGTAGSFETWTWEAGGFQMEVPDGRYFVTFSGGGLGGRIVREVTVEGQNVKLDGMAGQAGAARYFAGSSADDTLRAIDGVDFQIVGGGGSDTFVGASGNDVLVGDTIQIGHDTALSGQVYRLYQAALDRTPDVAGHLGWFTAIQSGTSNLTDAASGFVGSTEFQNVYGPLSDADFVELLYGNVLNREADPAGLESWVASISGGMSRAQVLLGFSESQEFTNATAEAAGAFAEANTDSIWADDVFRLYRATLDRDPDATGLAGWMTALGSGTGYLSVASGFVNSVEFQAVYGALGDADFVDLLYQNVLGRPADGPGLQGWTDMLGAGTTRSEVVRGFAQSREFVAATADDVVGFLRGLGTDDTFHAGGGTENRMTGGAMSDAFVFVAGQSTGTHVITDFEAWDILQFSGFGSDAGAIADSFTQTAPNRVELVEGDLHIVLHVDLLPDLHGGTIEIV